MLNISLGHDLPLAFPQDARVQYIFHATWTDKTVLPWVVHRIPLTGYDGVGQIRSSKKWLSRLVADLDIVVNQQADETQADCGRITVTVGATHATLRRDGYYSIKLVNPTDDDDRVRFIQGPALADVEVTVVAP